MRPGWVFLCVLNILPFTAIFHNRVFEMQKCLSHGFPPGDPSLYAAIALTAAIAFAGVYFEWIRIFTAPFFWAFLPLTIWIWDIPFSGHYICSHFHDNQVHLWFGLTLRSGEFYFLGVVLYWLLLRRSLGDRSR